MRIWSQTAAVQIMIDQKQLWSDEYLKHLCSATTNDVIFTREIKSRTSMAKDEESFDGGKLNFNLRNKRHLEK